MRRRDFLNSGLAVVGAAALPFPAIGASSHTAGRYAWAVAAAKARNVVSADILASSLKVSAEQAAGLMGRLQARGVIAAPGTGGIARVVAPVFKASGFTSSGPIGVSEVARAVERVEPKVDLSVREDVAVKVEDALANDDPLDRDDGAETTPRDQPKASISI